MRLHAPDQRLSRPPDSAALGPLRATKYLVSAILVASDGAGLRWSHPIRTPSLRRALIDDGEQLCDLLLEYRLGVSVVERVEKDVSVEDGFFREF